MRCEEDFMGASAVTDTWRERREEHGYPDPLLDEIAARFRLLGEPLRLKLLAALSQGEQSVGALVTLTGANQPNVSKHLAALTHGGLVARRKAGTTIYYTLADPSVLTLCDAVCAGIQQRYAAQVRALGLAGQPEAPTENQTEKASI
jgi:DNA-binding transcriptional ArsR family regulator